MPNCARGISVIHDALFLQLLQELGDVGADFFRVGGGELFLQFGDDFAEGALAVAVFEDLATGALQFDGAFGEEDDANFVGFAFGAPAASGGEAGLGGIEWGRHAMRPARKSRFLHCALRWMKPIAMFRSE